nr:ABC transporter permease [Actinopolyspora mortivallis]
MTQLVRSPGAMISSLVFPSLLFAAFVLPQMTGAPDPRHATVAVAQLCVFAFFTTCVFQIGFTVAEMRHEAWFVFLRTLPAGPLPRTVGQIFATTVVAIAGTIPILVLGGLFTDAQLSAGAIARGMLALLCTTIPFCLLGALFGYTLSLRTALGVISLASFLLAFLGGLFVMPATLGPVFDSISMLMPTRGPRELVAAAFVGSQVPWWSVVNLVAWLLIFTAGVVWSFRRDQNERYR